MYKQAFTALAFTLGSGLAFGSASCGPTCPASQPNCGTANASPSNAGASGSSSVTCDLLEALRKCMKDFCATTSNPYCTCFNRGLHYKDGFDIDSVGCGCIDVDAKAYCDAHQGESAASYDCAAQSSAVSSVCVPVQ